MPGRAFLSSPMYQSITRLVAGIVLAVILYQLAETYATSDCLDIQTSLREKGPILLAQLLLTATLSAIAGVPAAVIAVLSGILMGPLVGAPLTSLAITIGSTVLWGAGRFLHTKKPMPDMIERHLAESAWFTRMMNDRAASGFQWTALHGLLAPIPYPFVSFLIGAKVQHLNPQSFVAGIFISSILQVAGYCLAGASIGCAVVNHAVGASSEQYRTLMVVSCLVLLLLARLQNSLTRNN